MTKVSNPILMKEIKAEKELKNHMNFLMLDNLHKNLKILNFYRKFKIYPFYYNNKKYKNIKPISNLVEEKFIHFVVARDTNKNNEIKIELKIRKNKYVYIYKYNGEHNNIVYLGRIPLFWSELNLIQLQDVINVYILKRKLSKPVYNKLGGEFLNALKEIDKVKRNASKS